jgi:hypothetical protein
MRSNGITYDTGFINRGVTTRATFDPEIVRREMRVIRDDLHCDAVRVTGGDPDRLETAATYAADAGLEVWFCPFTCDLTTDELLTLLADCAERAERIRGRGAEVVFLTGSELTLTTLGFLPGATFMARAALFDDPRRLRELLADIPSRLNDFLGAAVRTVRERFGGKISYASLPFENVDWAPFDIISSDAAYRSDRNADGFRDAIRTFAAQEKPAAITEFGCTTYSGAAGKADRGDAIVEWGADGMPVQLDGDYPRDEDEQATYLCELLDVFEAEGVDTAFVNTFARYDLPHRDAPREDFDRASYGVVKVLEGRTGHTYPGLPWEPKAAFAALADRYAAGGAER